MTRSSHRKIETCCFAFSSWCSLSADQLLYLSQYILHKAFLPNTEINGINVSNLTVEKQMKIKRSLF